jgi:hypothetical protein
VTHERRVEEHRIDRGACRQDLAGRQQHAHREVPIVRGSLEHCGG